MRQRLVIASASLIAAAILAGPVSGQERAAWTEPVEPYMDEQTLLVVRLDLAGGEPVQLVEWMTDAVLSSADEPLAPERAREIRRRAAVPAKRGLRDTRRQFVEAGGGELFILLSTLDPPHQPRDEPPLVYLFPMGEGADADRLLELLPGQALEGEGSVEPGGWAKGRLDGMVAAGPPGALRRLRDQPAVEREQLAEAAPNVAGRDVQMLVLPTEQTRRVVEQMLPRLPEPIGGPTTQLTRGLRWAALGIEVSDEPGLRMVIQSADAEGAGAMRGLLERSLRAWVTLMRSEAHAPHTPLDRRLTEVMERELIPGLLPEVRGDRLVLDLDTAELKPLTASLFPVVREFPKFAKSTTSASKLSQLFIWVYRYAEDHGGRFPPDLQTLVEEGRMPPDFLHNPLRPEQEEPYVCVSPGIVLDRLEDPATFVVMHEAFEGWPEDYGVCVVFADGHVRRIHDEQRFRKLMEKTERALQGMQRDDTGE